MNHLRAHRAARAVAGAGALLAAFTLAACGGSSNHATPTASEEASVAAAAGAPFLTHLTESSSIASTVPGNGDVNPYGLAVVASSAGRLQAGSYLVSNFNDSANDQGTGTTIDEVSPSGTATLFAALHAGQLPGSCPGGVGLTTALAVLDDGYVVVGSLPTSNGKSATAKAGCLIVLNDEGKPVETIAGAQIVGPWDMTAVSHGGHSTLFVSNVLNGGARDGLHTVDNSTVLRIGLRTTAGQAPAVTEQRVIASGIPWRDDAEALVIGPTGVALGANGTLYLADTLANRITAIPNALSRTSPARAGGGTVTAGGDLSQPLGLVLAPNGDILTTNAGNGDVVEISPAGKQLLARRADPKNTPGSLFGVALAPGGGLVFVDDAENALRILRAAKGAAVVRETSSSQLGKNVLVDAQGRTLYVLSGESEGHLLCTGSACLGLWPALTVSSQAALAGAKVPGLAVLHRSEGIEQVTLNGMPLYTYAGDMKAGEVNGQGIQSFGGTWYALSASGQPITQPASGSGSSSGGYPPY